MLVNFGEKVRKLMLFFVVGGYWKGAGAYLLLFLCNAYTFETKRRK
jgi:hypothetical protein